jgi:carbon catabolite-derepressing protein kinase
MLIVDPVKRISIPEIRELEWFNTDLPIYLKSNENKTGDKIDISKYPEIIKELEHVTLSLFKPKCD